ncbi:alkaline phosphatase [Lysinibacillus pakistanensis]|uniref:Alkaline phosphatase n=1 Tax=Lysinibacillus pakistanensis TaxID=759811 RepID=A0AAX3X082_9BACI|nr:alkaline phosphatase [Lysinibacillus pakistanensis]MDM5232839.1 alkaline phosphatase [Lysinibacillus pakistanensis]WHY48336.1 alkaline phosphatase [Lysinibacillus pakistanensis]WHY53349.1 alkaline phosphatase [Lysinibacillus pakistanensis]
MKYSKKWTSLFLASALTLSTVSIATPQVQAEEVKKPTNVIMLVMDGSSNNAITLSRWYKGESLAMDEILTGAMRTYSAESAITDSAPAATALATGHKSNDKFIGVLPSVVNSPGLEQVAKEDAFRPVANVLEGAKQQGKATGLISTSEIQHATPAGFSAHVNNRSQYGDIAEQQVYQNIDVVLGGGLESLSPGTTKNARKDGEDLLNVLKEKNYALVKTRDELLNSQASKIWGSFAPSALAYDFDRAKTRASEPTLAEMTEKAINTLKKDEDGFFLFVEGSKVDWAAHANDTIGIISDILSFDDAVKEAIDFAKEDGNTLVVAVTDHGNSGITMGNINTTNTYSSIPVSAYIDPLKKATMTIEGALGQLKEDQSNLVEVAALYGLDNLTEEELTTLKSAKDLGSEMVKMLANRANIGYTTGGHTGEDVFLYSFGPSKITGLVENTDLAHAMAKFMGFELDKLTDELYIPATKAFTEKGFTTKVDVADKENPTFIAQKADVSIIIPVNKNTMVYKDASMNTSKTYTFDTINVYNGTEFYVSKKVLDTIQ